MATKHRLQKFLPCHGQLYPGNRWTKAHREWLRHLDLQSERLTQTFQCYLAVLLDQEERR
jgi:hypothetical protein